MHLHNCTSTKIYYCVVQDREDKGFVVRRDGSVDGNATKTIEKPSKDPWQAGLRDDWNMYKYHFVLIFEDRAKWQDFKDNHEIDQLQYFTDFTTTLARSIPPTSVSSFAVDLIASTIYEQVMLRQTGTDHMSTLTGDFSVTGLCPVYFWNPDMTKDYDKWDKWRAYYWGPSEDMDVMYQDGTISSKEFKRKSARERQAMYQRPFDDPGHLHPAIKITVAVHRQGGWGYGDKTECRGLKVNEDDDVSANTGGGEEWHILHREDDWGVFHLKSAKTGDFVGLHGDGDHLIGTSDPSGKGKGEPFRIIPTYSTGFFIGDKRPPHLEGYVTLDKRQTAEDFVVWSCGFERSHVHLREVGHKTGNDADAQLFHMSRWSEDG